MNVTHMVAPYFRGHVAAAGAVEVRAMLPCFVYRSVAVVAHEAVLGFYLALMAWGSNDNTPPEASKNIVVRSPLPGLVRAEKAGLPSQRGRDER
jgi:hypothetical protein